MIAVVWNFINSIFLFLKKVSYILKIIYIFVTIIYSLWKTCERGKPRRLINIKKLCYCGEKKYEKIKIVYIYFLLSVYNFFLLLMLIILHTYSIFHRMAFIFIMSCHIVFFISTLFREHFAHFIKFVKHNSILKCNLASLDATLRPLYNV